MGGVMDDALFYLGEPRHSQPLRPDPQLERQAVGAESQLPRQRLECE